MFEIIGIIICSLYFTMLSVFFIFVLVTNKTKNKFSTVLTFCGFIVSVLLTYTLLPEVFL